MWMSIITKNEEIVKPNQAFYTNSFLLSVLTLENLGKSSLKNLPISSHNRNTMKIRPTAEPDFWRVPLNVSHFVSLPNNQCRIPINPRFHVVLSYCVAAIVIPSTAFMSRGACASFVVGTQIKPLSKEEIFFVR